MNVALCSISTSTRLTMLVLSAALAHCPVTCTADEPADLIVLNGKILTLDAKSTVAEAVAIRDGKFVQIGTNAELQPLIGEQSKVLDAHGKSVVPGLIESHVHAMNVARGELSQAFVQLGTIAEIQQWVRNCVESTAEGTWIRIPRADITRIRERRMPTREELDAAAATRPVVFNWQYASRQLQVLNTAAMQAADITRDTLDPAGGKIVKGLDGEPTGVLENPGELTSRFLPTFQATDEVLLDSLETVLRRYNQVGITSMVERKSSIDDYRVFEKLKQAGRQTVRTTLTIGLSSDGTADGMKQFINQLPFRCGEGDDWLRIGSLKIFVDGGVLYGTAYLREPYGEPAFTLYGISDSTYRGVLSLPAEKVQAMIRTGHQLGWQMSAHVTGDAGVDVVLDAVEAADREQPIVDRRFTLIHAYFPHPAVAKRAAKLGVCVDTQPAWFYKDGDALAMALGGKRMESFIGLADWIEAGVKVALNSDHMQGLDPDKSLNPYNPFLTMSVAASRKTESGFELGPNHKVSREVALRMMTIDTAYLNFDEQRKGSIEVGKLGDLAVLNDDFLTCSEERVPAIRPLATVVGGKVVYEANQREETTR